jgi:hypothetical protein
MLIRNAVITLLFIGQLGFVPYNHEGYALLPFGDALVPARALFSSSSSAKGPIGVVVRLDFTAPWGGEGYLVMDVTLGPVGAVADATWDYYEKLTADTISFDAESVAGQVIISDRYVTQEETSLRLVIDATFTDGDQTRVIQHGVIVTAPAPEALRQNGALPPGMVIVDDGSGALVVNSAYPRGHLTCVGPVDEVVVYDEDEEYVDYVDEEIVIVDGEGSGDDYILETSYDDEYDYADSPDCSDDSSSSSYENDYDSADSGCGGDADSGNGDCVGDAVASTGPSRYAPTLKLNSGNRRIARQILNLSPLFLTLMILLVWREWVSPLAKKESAEA